MPTQTRHHRSALALLLVLVLVAIGSPIATARTTVGGVTTAARPTGSVPVSVAALAGPEDVRGEALRSGVISGRRVVVPRASAAEPSRTAATTPADWIRRPTPATPAAEPKAQSRTSGSNRGEAGAGGATYRGRNHVWIPALGVDRSVVFFSCTSSAYPGDRVYRWGCAGGNNVYLFGHAHSVFKPLHDAYVRGRLKTGMQLYHADGDGRVSTYAVAWWKVTTPDRGEFAYAAQSSPSVTLQTCVGAKSQFRLIVRLAKVG